MHNGFSLGAAHCTLIGRYGNTIPSHEGGGYIPVPRLHLPVGLGRASRSAFFFDFFLSWGFDASGHLKFASKMYNRD